MIEVFKQMVAALEDTSASKHISRNAAIQAGLKAIAELESKEPVAWRKREVGGDWQYFGWQETGMTHQAVERGNKNGFECEAIPATTTQRTEQEPVQDDHQAFIDSLPADGDDKMFMQIDHWARKSYKRHQSSVRGQAVTAADAYESHIVWAALRWAKENTPPQRTEQEPVALKRIAEKLRRAGASLPAPEVQGTIESCIVTGLSIALANVEIEIEALVHPPQSPRVVFPTMLRKMWSSGEVQAWLDENVNKEKSNGN